MIGHSIKLTKRLVATAEPRQRRYTIWDSGLPGFGLRVAPSGHKVFIARYRAGGGRTGTLRQEKVGDHKVVTLDQARATARKVLGAAAAGGDPVGDRQAARQAGKSVADVCDWYLKEASAGRILSRKGRSIKASTLESDRSRIEIHIKPLIGKRGVQSLRLSDIEGMQSDISAGTTARTYAKRPRGGLATGGGGVAARSLAMLHAIFEHAIRKGVVTSNPVKGARKGSSYQRKFRLSLDQVRLLGAAMRASTDENKTALAAIRFLLLSGFRRNEALALRPDWLLAAGGVDFPDTKAGPQVRPLGRSAIRLLQQQLARPGRDTWLFPADRGDGHFIGLPKVLARVAKLAKLSGVTPHSLRHTFASVAGEIGYSELTIAGLLGHTAGSVTSAYVHLDAALVTAADRVSSAIEAALDGRPSAKIIPVRKNVP